MADNVEEGISDTVLATPVAAVLATALAAAGSPSVVQNAAVRGAETWTLVTLAVLTVFVGRFIQDEYGDESLSPSEFIVLVLAPAITRVDLVLIMWTNLNRALIWGEASRWFRDSAETKEGGISFSFVYCVQPMAYHIFKTLATLGGPRPPVLLAVNLGG